MFIPVVDVAGGTIGGINGGGGGGGGRIIESLVDIFKSLPALMYGGGGIGSCPLRSVEARKRASNSLLKRSCWLEGSVGVERESLAEVGSPGSAPGGGGGIVDGVNSDRGRCPR